MSSPPASPGPAQRVHVHAPSRAYDVMIQHAGLGELGMHVRSALSGTSPARAFVFVDSGVPSTLVDHAVASLQAAGSRVATLRIDPSEARKSVHTLALMLEALTRFALDRREPVIAIGGGIVGDLAGFAAASYRRGVPWINCPTTLLSMVDAAVGGKTGMNVVVDGVIKKNMAGAFWQPHAVVADIQSLASLSDRAFRSGLAECIKHALLSASPLVADPSLADWTEQNMPRLLARDPGALCALIARNINVKARIVESDEREEAPDQDGGRALLNLGHTFAHAIEPLPDLSPTGHPGDAPLHHGEAVALGLVAAAALAVQLNLAPAGFQRDVTARLHNAGLPTKVAALPPSTDLLRAMRDDKKVIAGSLRLIVPIPGGFCTVVRDPAEAHVLAAIDAIRA